MLDLSNIRKDPDAFKIKLGSEHTSTIDRLLDTDEKYRDALSQLEEMRAEKNAFTKSIGALNQDEKKKKLAEMSELDQKADGLSKFTMELKDQLDGLLMQLPNLPSDKTPEGATDKDNKVIKKVGPKPNFGFEPRAHHALGETLDIIDTERSAKISGSRFSYLKKDGALLWNALVQYVLTLLLEENFIPFYSPVLVKKDIMHKTGYDSYTEGQEAYAIDKDGLFLVGTGEHALLPYHAGEIIDLEKLPLKYTTYSTCFRREAGSHGKDTKGILRVHQFDKQEMLILCSPDQSWDWFDALVSLQEKIISGLNLPYQLLEVCTGDLPKPSARVVDLECWIPSEQKYRETHSASNCTDYQARRNKIRFRSKHGANEFVHILNATAVTPRTLIALMENYQQKDGSIHIPDILVPWMHGIKTIKPNE